MALDIPFSGQVTNRRTRSKGEKSVFTNLHLRGVQLLRALLGCTHRDRSLDFLDLNEIMAARVSGLHATSRSPVFVDMT